MKKTIKFLILTFAVSLFATAKSEAQQYVKVPPTPPKEAERPKPNTKYEVWVTPEWVLVGDKYVYHAGFWCFPPISKSVYVPGLWKKSPQGYSWTPGYWKTPR